MGVFRHVVILFISLALLATPARPHEDEPPNRTSNNKDEANQDGVRKLRPAILGRDDHPTAIGVGRSGIGSDYKPKQYAPKPEPSEPKTYRYRDDDEYDRRRPYRDDDYDDSAADDYDRRPYRDREPVRDEYDRRPYRDRDPYVSRPAYRPVRRGQLPKPNNDRYDRRPVRDDYEDDEEPSEFTYRRGDDGKRDDVYVSDDKRDDVYVSDDDRDEYPPPRPIRRGSGNHNNRPASRPKDRDRPSRPVSNPAGGHADDHAPPIRRGGGHHDSGPSRPAMPASAKDDLHPSGHAAKKDAKCICVPYYQCQDGHIVTDGGGIIDIRSRRPKEDPPLDGKSEPASCGPIHVCCSSPETSTVKPYEHMCGRRNPTGINSRVLAPSNKGEADFGEWPWQAAVLKAEGKINIFMCGAVLIDKLHVLTVAHCVFHLYQNNEYPLKVRLGEWDTQTTSEFLAHEDYDVAKIIVHPEFRNTSLWNDLAILKLDEPVLFAPHIDTVCLPKYDDNFVDQNCVVTGWGKDAYKGGPFSNVMKEVAIQVIDSHKCEGMLRKTRLGRFFQLHEGFLCAGGEYGLDSCKGDGGGPLMCLSKDKTYALAGVVSWGLECGHVEVPGVYTKIQRYLDWISKTTGHAVVDYWPQEHRHHDHKPKSPAA